MIFDCQLARFSGLQIHRFLQVLGFGFIQGTNSCDHVAWKQKKQWPFPGGNLRLETGNCTLLGRSVAMENPERNGSLSDFSGNIIWLVVWNMASIVPYLGFLIIPIDELIFFQRGGPTTNQMIYWYNKKCQRIFPPRLFLRLFTLLILQWSPSFKTSPQPERGALQRRVGGRQSITRRGFAVGLMLDIYEIYSTI